MINFTAISALSFVLCAWIIVYAKGKKQVKITQEKTKEIILQRLKRV
jgi:hypothetical protein